MRFFFLPDVVQENQRSMVIIFTNDLDDQIENTSLVSFQMTQIGQECSSAGQAASMGCGQWCEVQQGQVPGPTLGLQQCQAVPQSGQSGWRTVQKKRAWGYCLTAAELEPALLREPRSQGHPGLYQKQCDQQG